MLHPSHTDSDAEVPSTKDISQPQEAATLESLINDVPKLLDDVLTTFRSDIMNSFSLPVDQRFRRLEIEAMNARIRSRNRGLQTFDPVFKTVSIHLSFTFFFLIVYTV